MINKMICKSCYKNMTCHDIWYAKPYVNEDGKVKSPGETFFICTDCQYNLTLDSLIGIERDFANKRIYKEDILPRLI